MTIADAIAAELRQHVGRENSIRSAEIASALRLRKSAARTIRQIIADEDWEAREMLVVGIPGFGFYVANDIAECNAYLALLLMLRDSLTAKIERFKRSAKKQGIHLGEQEKL